MADDDIDRLYEENQQKMMNNIPEIPPEIANGYKLPDLNTLLEALNGFDISESEKDQLREYLTKPAKTSFSEKEIETPPKLLEHTPIAQLLVMLIALILVIMVFAFFGYKLYKSLVDRERKREEKHKLKQEKKKKK